jgi:hypothetical protein
VAEMLRVEAPALHERSEVGDADEHGHVGELPVRQLQVVA